VRYLKIVSLGQESDEAEEGGDERSRGRDNGQSPLLERCSGCALIV
jgi:hypothetical protein